MQNDEELVLPPVLRTKRLILRPVEPDDASSIYAYASNPEVARLTLWDAHQSIADSRAFIEDYAYANYRQEVPDPYGIALEEEPRCLLGTVGCYWASPVHRTMELGFALGKKAWGRGYTTEAAWAVLCFCFSICRPHRIQARCHPDNAASARILEKLGMDREGLLRSAACKGDEVWDVLLYSVLRRDWERYIESLPDGPPGTPL